MNGPLLVTDIPGPRSRRAAARLAEVECPAFDARRRARSETSGAEQVPIIYAEARGAHVFDVDGNRYVDFVAGFGAVAFGHHAAIIEDAAIAQRSKLGLALGDVYSADVKVELLERLRELHPDPRARVLLGLSGADAVTAALKTAALCTQKPGVIAFEGAYHGLSHGPLAICGLKESFREPFASQTGTFARFAPYPRSDGELERVLARIDELLAPNDVGAVVVEPILGRGGVVTPPDAFLAELAERCHASGALLVVDEVWTGIGRSGDLLASRRAGVDADIICVGKALGGGEAISACIGSDHAMAGWGALGGTTLHTATHFGSPIACATALAVLHKVQEPGFLEDVRRRGDTLQELLRERTRAHEVRGRGMMIGVDLGTGAAALRVTQRLLRRGYIVLTGGVGGETITLTPPLDIDAELFEPFASAFADAIAEESE